jgi:DNA-binding transcriptional regulator LsrR (DeoR family)
MSEMDRLSERALALFRYGMDTYDIAKTFGIPEAKASRLLWVARCREMGLPATFMNKAREVKLIAPKQANAA